MDNTLNLARQRLMEALGRQSGFWGVGKITGEIYATLYLSKQPMSLTELAGTLGVTKGNVSVAIRALEQLGMVRRLQRPGDRRVYFEAEPDFWVIAQRVLARRQKPEFDESFRMLDESIRTAESATPTPAREFMLTRLKALQDFYNELDQVVDLLLSIPPQRMSRLIRLAVRMSARWRESGREHHFRRPASTHDPV
ncbi:MAG: MarR family transcriptional regulator [Alicyclobacillus sp.]|nr:MarR family transcriptional regulator [Alicyclobacillus sp.]